MLRDIVVNLLHNLGGRSEVDRYLSEYAEGKRCTVVKVGGGLIQDDLEELASALALLHHVGLRPVVIHGAGPQLTAEMESAGIEPEWHDGLRVTTPKVLAAATKVFGEVGTELADALEAKGVRTRRLTNGVFHATPTETPGLGLVGEITGLDGEAIATAIERDRMPIIAPIGTTEDGQLLNVNADTAARAMATWRRSQKVIFLTPTGGILNPHGKVIPAVNCEQTSTRCCSTAPSTAAWPANSSRSATCCPSLMWMRRCQSPPPPKSRGSCSPTRAAARWSAWARPSST